LCNPGPWVPLAGGTKGATGSYGPESSRRAPMDARGLQGRTRCGPATRLARSYPSALPCAGSSGASGAFDASGSFGSFGPFGFADRLPDRTERNARRAGAPEAGGVAPARARRGLRYRVPVRGPDAAARTLSEGPAAGRSIAPTDGYARPRPPSTQQPDEPQSAACSYEQAAVEASAEDNALAGLLADPVARPDRQILADTNRYDGLINVAWTLIAKNS
jgi:hypothetical protein